MSFNDLYNGRLIVAADTETTGLSYNGSVSDYGFYPAQPFAFSFTTYEGKNWYVSFQVDPFTRRVRYEKNMDGLLKLIQLFQDPRFTWIFHNANFDVSILNRINIKIAGKIIDSMILSHINNVSDPVALKPLCKKLFDYDDGDQKDLIASVTKARRKAKKLGWCIATKDLGFGTEPNKADYWLGDPELCKLYAIGDTDRTMGLYWALEDRYNSDKEYRSLVDMEHELMYVIRNMQDMGVKVDEEKIAYLEGYYTGLIKRFEKEKEALGFKDLNSRSSKQMQKVFYDILGCKKIYKRRKDKKSGETKETLTTDGAALNKWKDEIPLAKCLVEISAAEHELNSFILPFKNVSTRDNKTGWKILRPNFRTVGVITGRISCSKPNLMNISSDDSAKKVSEETAYRARECFIPREGYTYLFMDYSQIELRVAAYLSQDEVMMEALEEGGDIHTMTAEACFSSQADYQEEKKHYRKSAKVVNFGILYGMGNRAVRDAAKCSFSEAESILYKYWNKYTGLAEYNSSLKEQIDYKGYVKNPFGRTYYMKPEQSYKALNYMVQGSSAEVMKRAMINVYRHIKNLDAQLILTVHDEICIELSNKYLLKNFALRIKRLMQSDLHTYFNMPEPFGVEAAVTKSNWAEKKDYPLN